MSGKTISAQEFEEQCLALVDEVGRTHQPVTITDHGRAVARLVPLGDVERSFLYGETVTIGGLKGSVVHFDDPFSPVAHPSEWDVLR
jgi:prevent-host-death family protein